MENKKYKIYQLLPMLNKLNRDFTYELVTFFPGDEKTVYVMVMPRTQLPLIKGPGALAIESAPYENEDDLVMFIDKIMENIHITVLRKLIKEDSKSLLIEI